MNSQKIEEGLKPIQNKIQNHPIFNQMDDLKKFCFFTEHHVFAVWDFMCLLKAIEHHVSYVKDTCWLPPVSPFASHFIHEILAEEEGDIAEDGSYISHFELYLEAMKESGANTQPIMSLLKSIKNGICFPDLLNNDQIPEPSKRFMENTFSTIQEGSLHCLMASFTFGRENLTGPFFASIVKRLNGLGLNDRMSKFTYYLNRHIELDGESHSIHAKNILDELCKNDNKKWIEALDTAKKSLSARYDFLETAQKGLIKKFG